jgi:hypothetical protein
MYIERYAIPLTELSEAVQRSPKDHLLSYILTSMQRFYGEA